MIAYYNHYKTVFEGVEMPYAFVDLDLFDQNIQQLLQRAANKSIRIASKSLRCPALIQRVLDASPQFKGLMCYTATEAVWLAQQGFDDLLVAYPTVHPTSIEAVIKQLQIGKKIVLMVDKLEHLTRINKVASAHQLVVPVCMDIDMSSRYLGLHFGVHRSAIKTLATAKTFMERCANNPYVRLCGIMGYEAQIAGLGNNVSGQVLKNYLVRFLQKKSMQEISQRRSEIVELSQKMFGQLDFVNGGGTGSIEQTVQESLVTEVTVGSGFYSPTLFDNYKQFCHLSAAAYAIEIVRQPTENIYTCLGGGYIASGAVGRDKWPSIHLPYGAQLTNNEMVGEVQTPVVYKGAIDLQIGDPIFLRHAKAGELCERFNHLLLLQQGKIRQKVKTYRGSGQCFL
jgi:D-serine deaminase-like pyridoxal phosphate-dependent protein